MIARPFLVAALAASVLLGCPKKDGVSGEPRAQAVGLVTDVGGRGDGSFNDSAIRGLELWAAGKVYAAGSYRDATGEELEGSIPGSLRQHDPPIRPLAIRPLVLQSRTQEDYEPSLQLLVDQGAGLAVGVGFMLENAVEAVAQRNPQGRFLLIDSPLMDAGGKPYTLPNVRTVVFREEQAGFLVGALAGLASPSGRIGFVGGMEIPLIKKFEAGFRAGVKTTNPEAAARLLANYTGSFDNVAAGKQVAQDLLSKGVDVVFHAAGTDGLGVIQAVREARAAGKNAYVIGVDSDQSALDPEAVLTSAVKRVDLAIYETTRELTLKRFAAGDRVMGLAEDGVGYAEVRVDFPGKAEALARVEALRERIVRGELEVPSTLAGYQAFQVGP